jgi:cysteine desulfuration protein SufE
MLEFQDMFSELFDLEDNLDKYDWIIEYGAVARPVFTVNKIDKNLIHGCTSNLWLEKIDSNLYCYGESLIVQGISSMICDWYNQADELSRSSFGLHTLNNIGLAPMLSAGRQNGVANLIAKIKTL